MIRLCLGFTVMFLTTLMGLEGLTAQDRAEAALSVNVGNRGQQGHTYYIFVNGECIGNVGTGSSKTFSFVPAKDAVNTMYVDDAHPLEFVFGRDRSESKSFTCGSGGRVVFDFQYLDTSKQFVAATVTVKDEGVLPGKSKPLAPKVAGFELKKKLVEREIDEELLETPPGVEQEYELSRVIERTVSFTDTVGKELSAGLDIKLLSADIRSRIEKTEESTLKQTETIRRNIKVNGDKSPALLVKWVGIYRPGDVELEVGGTVKKVPFELLINVKPVLKVPGKDEIKKP